MTKYITACCIGVWAGATVLAAGCGKVNGRSGIYAGMDYCQDMGGQYHFKAFIPPWKYRKEYRCEDGDFRNCSRWSPTGRYVFVVSDSPFVNFDSEIIVSLTVEILQGSALTQVQTRLAEIAQDPKAELVLQGGNDYAEFETVAEAQVLDISWRQERTFEGKTYRWYRRDAFIQASLNTVFHLEFFSILSLYHPEFNALVKSFDKGPAPDGAPCCVCMDEHSTTMAECL